MYQKCYASSEVKFFERSIMYILSQLHGIQSLESEGGLLTFWHSRFFTVGWDVEVE